MWTRLPPVIPRERWSPRRALSQDALACPALSHVAKGTDKRKAWEDVLWAILNTREFLFRH